MILATLTVYALLPIAAASSGLPTTLREILKEYGCQKSVVTMQSKGPRYVEIEVSCTESAAETDDDG